jgi:hypothetical protein
VLSLPQATPADHPVSGSPLIACRFLRPTGQPIN